MRFDIDNSSFFDSLFVGSGLMYEKEVYKIDLLEERDIVKSSNYLSFTKFVNEKITFDSTTYYQFDVSNLKDYRILNISTLSFNITEEFGFFTRLDFRNHAIPIAKELDYNYAEFSVGFEINL